MNGQLPIYDIEAEIVAALASHRRLILQAPTGSGKSTQVPQMLLDHGLLGTGKVVILQPRRLATRLLAARVAFERGGKPGGEVGYQIRFDNVTSAATRIQFETEGILLRQLIRDPSLHGVQAIIFDEFHERHLYGDITLARVLEIQERQRPDLLIIVMSATLESGALEEYLAPASSLKSAGRTFPVDVCYLPNRLGTNSPPVWELAAESFAQFAKAGNSGDVLIFMPGGYEISRTIDAVRQTKESRGYLLLPLHGELQTRDQDAAVAQYGQPKVVVATNVAETSITIDGIRCVIDSGVARVPRYDANRGINTLLVEKISRSSADQRTGRAGRTAPGQCLRLWSQAEHHERPAHDLPEVKRLDLSEVVLILKAAGVDNLRQFRWLEPPGETALAHAEQLLQDLGALESAGERSPLTAMGHRMLAFPVHPRYARMLIAAQEFGCVYSACLIAALTQGRSLLLRRAEHNIAEDDDVSDFQILMRAWKFAVSNQFRIEVLNSKGIHAASARQVGPLLEQFLRIAREQGLDPAETEAADLDAVRKCILLGFSDRVARRIDDATSRCQLVHGRRGNLAKESVVRNSALLVAAEVQEIGGRGDIQTVLTLATAISIEWLRQLFPNDMRRDVHVWFDSATRRVQAESVQYFRDLALSEERIDSPPADTAARLLSEEIIAGRLSLPSWNHGVTQWIERLNLLVQSCPDLALSPIQESDRRHIIEQFCFGSISFKEIKDRDIQPVVRSWLSPAQRALVEKYAPERVALSNGRAPRISYESGKPPFIALRIQELFGVQETPRIAMGRVPLAVHILAPSMRPVQVTQDLANFWREHYPEIKSQLKRKYPKHEWR